MKKRIIFLSLMLVLLCLSACSVEILSDVPDKTAKIGFIAQETGSEFWAKVEDGAAKAAAELGAELLCLPKEEGMLQSEQIMQAVESGCRALILSPEDSEETLTALQSASAAGISLIYADGTAEVEAAVRLRTHYRSAGRIAANTMLEILQEQDILEGEIAILSPGAEDEAASLLEEGFREAFAGKAFVLLETEYCVDEAAAFQTAAEKDIGRKVDGIFACCENAAIGAGNAAGETGARVSVVGMGRSEALKPLVEEGFVRSALMEKPDVLGYKSVKTAAAMVQGLDLNTDLVQVGISVIKSEAPYVMTNDYKIAFIARDRLDSCWHTMEAGVARAAEELGCEVINLSPKIRNDKQQRKRILKAVDAGCDAIVIAANDRSAVSDTLQEAMEAGVKTVCVDTPVDVTVSAQVYAGDMAAGALAAETMIAELEAREIREGTIGIIGVDADTRYSAAREKGFREAFAGKSYTLLETEYSGGDAAKAYADAGDFFAEDVAGIFCCNEGSSIGAGDAAREKKTDAVIVGFGAEKPTAALLEAGFLHAVLIPDWEQMGYEGIQAACAVLHGAQMGDSPVDAGVCVLTREE